MARFWGPVALRQGMDWDEGSETGNGWQYRGADRCGSPYA